MSDSSSSAPASSAPIEWMDASARQKAKYTILLTAFLDILGFSIIIPQLAVYAAQFGAHPWMIGLLASVYSMMGFLFTPVWGSLSDKYGRRPILLISIFGTAMGYIAFALAHSLPLLFLARIIDGITGGNISTAQAYLSDITPPQERSKNYGLFGATFGIAFAIGPLIGSAMTHLPGAWGGNFGLGMFSMTLGLINLALAAKFLPETLSPQIRAANQAKPPSPNPISGYVKTLSIPRLNTIVLIGLLATTAFATIQGTYAVYILKEYTRPLVQQDIARNPQAAIAQAQKLESADQSTAPTLASGEGDAAIASDDVTAPYDKSLGGDYQGPPSSSQTSLPVGLSWRHVEKLLVRPESARVVGNIFGVIGLLSLFIQGGLMRKLPQKVGEVPLVIIGTAIMALGLLSVTLVSHLLPHQVWGQYLASAILTLGNGLSTPVLTSLASQFAPEAERGEILGVFQSVQSLGRILGPNIGNLALGFISAGAPFVTGALIMLVAAVMALQLRAIAPTPERASTASPS
ncbi:tetracycline resistance protein, class C [Abditibacteriota bacterium]|nr:tetracycline resistance protein, class C [Abditibacteriota bacterium]